MAQWTWIEVRVAATAIANAHRARRRWPAMRNALDVLPPDVREAMIDDAMAVARARGEAPTGTADDY